MAPTVASKQCPQWQRLSQRNATEGEPKRQTKRQSRQARGQERRGTTGDSAQDTAASHFHELLRLSVCGLRRQWKQQVPSQDRRVGPAAGLLAWPGLAQTRRSLPRIPSPLSLSAPSFLPFCVVPVFACACCCLLLLNGRGEQSREQRRGQRGKRSNSHRQANKSQRQRNSAHTYGRKGYSICILRTFAQRFHVPLSTPAVCCCASETLSPVR